MQRRKNRLIAGQGRVIDPNFFPPWLLKNLQSELITSPLTDSQKLELIQHCNDRSQVSLDAVVPSAQIVEQLQRLASDSRRLLSSLSLLEQDTIETLQGHEAALVFMQKPAAPMPESVKAILAHDAGIQLLPAANDWVKSLEICADYAASMVVASRQSKPEQARARYLISLAASKVKEMTGKYPAKTRDNWFAAFVDIWFGFISLEAGSRLIKSGIEMAEGTLMSE